jgi:hypothetical protein
MLITAGPNFLAYNRPHLGSLKLVIPLVSGIRVVVCRGVLPVVEYHILQVGLFDVCSWNFLSWFDHLFKKSEIELIFENGKILSNGGDV